MYECNLYERSMYNNQLTSLLLGARQSRRILTSGSGFWHYLAAIIMVINNFFVVHIWFRNQGKFRTITKKNSTLELIQSSPVIRIFLGISDRIHSIQAIYDMRWFILFAINSTMFLALTLFFGCMTSGRSTLLKYFIRIRQPLLLLSTQAFYTMYKSK